MINKYSNIKLSRDAKEHMYIQLFYAIKEMIEKEILKSNEKLPPIRKLADLLNVNNVTVVKAYDLLEKNKYVYKRVGSGTFVLPQQNLDREIENFEKFEDEIYEDLRLMDRGQIQISDDMINFASATPTPQLFPIDDFKNVLNEVLDRDKGFAFGYQDSKGFYPLRESIVEYLKFYKIITSTDNIQIISGAQQGIDVVAKVLLNYGDTIIVESPTYTGAIASFKTRGTKIVEVPIKKDGIDLEKLELYIKEYKPKAIYTMPNFQNPTGYSHSLIKKKKLLEIVKKNNLIIIEDDYLSDLNFYTDDNFTLKSMDNDENVIYIKSFSKIFMPGLRLGFLVVPLRFKNEIIAAKHTSDISTSSLIQRAFDLYLRKGIWKKHIKYMKKVYKERFDVMIEKLEELPNEISYEKPKGGINFWIDLPNKISVNEFYRDAIKEKIVFVPGSIFYPSKTNSNSLRLSIASVYPEEIKRGMDIFNNLLKKYLDIDKKKYYFENREFYRPIL
ncbi:PLP-dependent aminotransferase family protein [Caminicella sporogenes]|uniref:MocR-like pyridoxine biosynthesis transcription factor PdxR n=1 Tax=Caminicella sporogenes TaxID=166485 RepID=UPI0025420EE3|nr:PLP-dependent aminotransferase family protein [Caminicella sporogenes]WIF94854.1 PLP-dependent aminotransferase family protein [Caminicella sporogenes]